MSLRASDADREATAEQLRVGAAEGRLDADELEERLGAAYAAKTVDELRVLTADLPAPPRPAPTVPRMRPQPQAPPPYALTPPRSLLAPLLVLAICAALWVASGANAPFWPAWLFVIVLVTRVARHGRRQRRGRWD